MSRTKGINKNMNKNKEKRKKTRKVKKNKKSTLKCAPKSSSNDFSCYSNSHLFELKKAWNKSNPPKIKTNNPKEIWKFLHNQYKDKCGKESCWIKEAQIPDKFKKKMIKTAFAPKAPNEWKKNPTTWLSSTDIIKVMEQYEMAYPYYRFIGPSPIDFDKKLAFIQNKKKVLGMIFNLDPHYKDGSHWVAMYFNIDTGELYYFDSVGDKIPHQINRLRQSIQDQSKSLNIKTKFDELYPHVEHQMRNTECGMYCLYFLIMMLSKEKSWKHFKSSKNRITDEEMEKFRKVFFNKDL